MPTTNGGDMPTTESAYHLTRRSAAAMGRDDGRARASWYFDGNTSHATYVDVYRGLRDGDPAILDTIPCSPLSGEWADDPTPRSVLDALDVDEDDEAANEYLDAYEDGFSEAAYQAIEQAAYEGVRNPGALNTGRLAPIAYTYEAAHHCPECAAKRFGVDEAGFVLEESRDSEGNEVGAVSPWDEWQQFAGGREVLACDDCGAELDTYEPEPADDDTEGRV
jgi:hypothetical protein